VLASPDLRRLQLAGAAGAIGGWAYWVVVSLYAYAHGGAVTVGIVAGLRLGAVAIASPFAGVVADRFPRRRVLLVADSVRAVSLFVAAAIDASGGPAAAVIAFVVLFAIANSAFRPALSALLPTLARTPEELTAANVTASAVESVSWFAGPALGGLVVAAAGTSWGFVFAGACLAVSAGFVSRIRVRETVGQREPGEKTEGVVAQAVDGLKAITENGGLALLVGLFSAQTFTSGAQGVLAVVLAKTVLGGGAATVGYLNAAEGAGAIIGSIGTLGLVGTRRLATVFGLGITLWGLPLVVVGIKPELALALVLFLAIGFGNTLADVAGYTLLQRAVPDHVLARVTGALESVVYVTVAVGALAAPFIVEAVGVRWALVAVGLVLPVAVAATWPALRRLDTAPSAQLGERLRLTAAQPVFAPLPPPVLETIAHALEERELAAGEELFAVGAPGDRFYLIASGEVLALPPGEEPRVMRSGESFGEIALLRNIPRTAGISARTPARLYGLGRDLFVATVTGHADSESAAEATIASRLGTLGGLMGR
jgi:MFS family permease